MSRQSEATEFDFVGGEYPGTGGTCADILEPEDTCTLVISFSPATAGTYTSEFELSYFNGFDTYTEAFTVTGISATP